MHLYDNFSQDEQHHLYELFNLLANYDASQLKLDLDNRNFMQTLNGKHVVLAPVSKEVVDLITPNQTRRYKDRQEIQRYGRLTEPVTQPKLLSSLHAPNSSYPTS